MGVQNSISAEKQSIGNVELTVRSSNSVDYIIDLLGELEVIANLSGLSELSEGISEVISNQRSGTFKAP